MKTATGVYGGNTHFQQMINRMKPYSVHASSDPIARVIKFRKVKCKSEVYKAGGAHYNILLRVCQYIFAN